MNALPNIPLWTYAVRVVKFAAQFLLVLVSADFVSGLIHWFEDAYVREDFPLVGRWIGRENILHHHDPRHFTRKNWWQSSWDLACVSLLILIAAWAVGHLTWHVWLFALLTANANQMHKWAHRTPRENGGLITFLHHLRLLQTTRHHARHHTDPKNSHYCVMTNFLNPVLDGVGFWEAVEWLLLRAIGLRRRPDTSVKPRRPMLAGAGTFR